MSLHRWHGRLVLHHSSLSPSESRLTKKGRKDFPRASRLYCRYEWAQEREADWVDKALWGYYLPVLQLVGPSYSNWLHNWAPIRLQAPLRTMRETSPPFFTNAPHSYCMCVVVCHCFTATLAGINGQQVARSLNIYTAAIESRRIVKSQSERRAHCSGRSQILWEFRWKFWRRADLTSLSAHMSGGDKLH